MAADDDTQNLDFNNSSSVVMGEEASSHIFSNLSYEQIMQLEGDASFYGPKKNSWKFPGNCIGNFQSSPNYAAISESNEPAASFIDQFALLASFRTPLDDFSAGAGSPDTGSNDSSFTNISSLSASTSSLEKCRYLGFVSSLETCTLSDDNDSGKLPSPELLPSASSLSGSTNLGGTDTTEDKAPDFNSPGNENAESANLESTNSMAIDEYVNEIELLRREMINFSQVLYPTLEVIWKPETTVSHTVNSVRTAVIDRNNVVWYTPTMCSSRLLMIPVEEPENLPFEIYFPFFSRNLEPGATRSESLKILTS